MSDYSKTTNFTAKDNLSPGDANKKINGSLFDTEFDAIQTAVATKADSASPTFTGTVVMTAPQIQDTSADHQYVFAVNELAADRTVTLPLLTGNDTFVFNDHTATLTAKTIDLTSNTLQGSKTEFNTALESDTFLMASDLLDEDTMTSNSATAPASQQSIKAYVDAQIAAPGYVDTSGVPVANDIARFTDADTIEGRSYAELKADLNLEIGTDVQAYDADLAAIAALAKTDGNFIVGNGSTWVAESGNTVLASIGVTATTTELNYVDGVTSAIQTQIDSITSGALIFLNAQTASTSASIEWNNTYFDGTYDEYVVKYFDVVPQTDAVDFIFKTSSDNGATFDGSAGDYVYDTDWTGTFNTATNGHILLNDNAGSGAGESCSGTVHIIKPSSTNKTLILHNGIGANASVGYGGNPRAFRDSAADVDAIQFSMSSGNIASGTFVLYGVKTSA